MVSIVVPVYNVGKYIGKCIESVLEQTYKNLELILVVDGATDNSIDVCNHYKNIDSRITVIEKQNGGVSSARNIGIKAAKGNYIMFIDGDDWIEPDTLEAMVAQIIEKKVDSCYCAKYMKDNTPVETAIAREYADTVISAEKAIKLHLHFGFVASPCFSLTLRTKVDKVLFNEEIYAYEDWEYNFRQLHHLDSIYILNRAFYHYRTVNGSASKSVLNERKLSCFRIAREVKAYIEKKQLPYDKDVKTLEVYFLYHLLVILANGEYARQPAKELCKKAREILITTLTSGNISLRNKIYTVITAIHPRLFCITYKIKNRV